jgi:hypothetical protein
MSTVCTQARGSMIDNDDSGTQPTKPVAKRKMLLSNIASPLPSDYRNRSKLANITEQH